MRTLLLLLAITHCVLHPTTASAECPAIEYKAPDPTSGYVRLSMTGLVVGKDMGSMQRCFTGTEDILATMLFGPAPEQAAPGSVVGWVQVRGEGDYMILYRGVNEGRLTFEANWPIVKIGASALEVQPEHPAARNSTRVKQSLSSYLHPMGANQVAFNFRFPLFRDADRFLPAVEITVTDRPAGSLGVSFGPFSAPIEARASSFSFQIKPWFIVQLPARLRR